MTINYNDGAANQSTARPLTGTAVAPALLTISDSPLYDFGTLAVTRSVDKSFTITNTGAVNATTVNGTALTGPFSFKGGAFPGTGGSCGATLIPAATCSVVVTFNPTAIGSFSATMSIGYVNGVSSQTSTRDMQGARSGRRLGVSDGPTYSFGTWPVGDTREKTLTVTNNGGVTTTSLASVALTAPFTYNGGSYPGTGATCAATLNPTANVRSSFNTFQRRPVRTAASST